MSKAKYPNNDKRMKKIEEKIKWLNLDPLQEQIYRQGLSDGLNMGDEILHEVYGGDKDVR